MRLGFTHPGSCRIPAVSQGFRQLSGLKNNWFHVGRPPSIRNHTNITTFQCCWGRDCTYSFDEFSSLGPRDFQLVLHGLENSVCFRSPYLWQMNTYSKRACLAEMIVCVNWSPFSLPSPFSFTAAHKGESRAIPCRYYPCCSALCHVFRGRGEKSCTEELQRREVGSVAQKPWDCSTLEKTILEAGEEDYEGQQWSALAEWLGADRTEQLPWWKKPEKESCV